MLQEFKQIIDTKFHFLNKAHVLVAVSGGLDSMVLLHLMKSLQLNIIAAHCNFGLRGHESDEDAHFVRSYCEMHRIRCFVKQFDTKHPKNSIQVAARNIRYHWFDKLCDSLQLDYIATAHHSDDHLETFLINFTRGSGLGGLKGIPLQNRNIVRPLLSFSKAQLLNFAQTHKLVWREDSSNATDDYLRNSIRHHVVPALKAVDQKSFNQSLLSISYLNDAHQALEKHINEVKSTVFKPIKNGHKISLKKLRKLFPLRFWVHQFFNPYGFHYKEVIKLTNSDKGKHIFSGTHRLEQTQYGLFLTLKTTFDHTEQYEVFEDGIKEPIILAVELNPQEVDLNAHVALLNPKMIKFPLVLRRHQKGDRFFPVGMKGSKKISKYFKDEKMTSDEKMAQWLLTCGNQVVWVVGKRVDKRYASTVTPIKISIK